LIEHEIGEDFGDDNADWLKPAGKEKKKGKKAEVVEQMDLGIDTDSDVDEDDSFDEDDEDDEDMDEEAIEAEMVEKKLGKESADMEVGMEDEDGTGRISRGQGDIAQIKQQIEDDVSLLQQWRGADMLDRGGRTHSEVMDDLAMCCSKYYGYSGELSEYFLAMFKPEEAIQFFEANEKPRPLTIRANSLKTRRRVLAQQLIARGAQVCLQVNGQKWACPSTRARFQSEQHQNICRGNI